MSAIWNWLCFPKHRFNAGKTQQTKRHRRRKKDNVVTLQKRKLLEDTGRFQIEQSVTDNNHSNSAAPGAFQKQNNIVPNKKRRVQDIFNTDLHHSDSSLNETSTRLDKNVYNDNFTHMNAPGRFYMKEKNKRPTNSETTDNVYGYVPKTMQNLYASTALEGQKIEDYFSNLHSDTYFNKFANSENATKDKTGNVLQILPFTHTSSSSGQEDKMSLIEEGSSDDDMDEGHVNNFKHLHMCPRTNTNIEESFHSMLNSTEEVLY